MLAQSSLAGKMGTILSFKSNVVISGELSIKKKKWEGPAPLKQPETQHELGMQNTSLYGYTYLFVSVYNHRQQCP